MKELKLKHRLQIPVWFMSQNDKFYLQNDGEHYTPYNKANLRLILRNWGIRSRAIDDEVTSPIDSFMSDCLLSKIVDYAGPLAGYKQGCYQFNERRILVTDNPHIIEADSHVEFPMIRNIIDQMFNGEDIDQSGRGYLNWTK